MIAGGGERLDDCAGGRSRRRCNIVARTFAEARHKLSLLRGIGRGGARYDTIEKDPFPGLLLARTDAALAAKRAKRERDHLREPAPGFVVRGLEAMT